MKHKVHGAVGAVLLFLTLLFLAGCDGGSSFVSPDESDVPPPSSGGDDPANAPPQIWGEPGTSAQVGVPYAFQPDASDADGDVLEFTIDNEPAWADFDSATGALTGTPRAEDLGTSTDIVISVTDGNSVTSLPSFTVTVDEPGSPTGSEPPPATNTPPVISGTPNLTAIVGTAYSFQPEASDADGDNLSFSIVNRPAWAAFDATTGRLDGTPTAADVGQGALIELSVTDGSAIAALPEFGITVEQVGAASYTVSWIPPTLNEDGSPLTDLAGYRIYYGTVSGEYTETIAIDSPGVTSYLIENLAPGRYYLVMTSYAHEMESQYTPELVFDAEM
jgi:hypothetical protein